MSDVLMQNNKRFYIIIRIVQFSFNYYHFHKSMSDTYGFVAHFIEMCAVKKCYFLFNQIVFFVCVFVLPVCFFIIISFIK